MGDPTSKYSTSTTPNDALSEGLRKDIASENVPDDSVSTSVEMNKNTGKNRRRC